MNHPTKSKINYTVIGGAIANMAVGRMVGADWITPKEGVDILVILNAGVISTAVFAFRTWFTDKRNK